MGGGWCRAGWAGVFVIGGVAIENIAIYAGRTRARA